ncbi:hypothetical protein BYT27DRAFT_7209006 [Phlegmacium glaucopus]|nr:hypothetical protein BYT27DRAFT_7209006 [Phlegmacium glaucopus]
MRKDDKHADAAVSVPWTTPVIWLITSTSRIITAGNNKWLSQIANGNKYTRELKVLDPSVRYAEYELVVLQPNHFLPDNSLLPLYSQQQGQVVGLKQYKMAADQTIQVAELLYFMPTERASVDAEMGFPAGADNESGGSTARQQRQTATCSDGGRMDADYWRSMLSGRGFLIDCECPLVDLELNNDDMDVLRVLREIEESNRTSVIFIVEMWRETVEP